MDIAPDGTMVARTDTYGAYLWNGTQWQQLVTTASMPAAFTTQNNVINHLGQQGVYEIQIAPSNSNIMYMMYEGYIFQSANKGTTWTQTSFAPVTTDTVDAYRFYGQKMAVDPNNSNVVYAGTPQNGLFVTTNGGASWQSVSAVPVGANAGITGIEFDPALGVTGGKTNTIFAASSGHGVYESTNGGISWSSIGGPSNVTFAAVSSTGVYYAVGNSNSVWSFNNGTWTQLLSDPTNGIETVAVDPFNANEIVAQNQGGNLYISYNAGATWSGINYGNQLSSTDIPWLASTGDYMAIGATLFDPLVPNKLWVSDGIGVWNTTNLPTANFQWNTPVVWHDQSIGIEQLVADAIVVTTSGHPVLASQDRPFIYVDNPDAYTSTYGPVMGKTIVAGWSLDYASSNPNFLVGIADYWGVEESGYSADGGKTWNLSQASCRVPGPASLVARSPQAHQT